MLKARTLNLKEALDAGVIPTLGRVFYVINSTSDPAYADLIRKTDPYPDGVQKIYVGAGSDAIQSALDACVAGRDDYVLILPSNTDYDLTAKLTMSKRSVHLIGMDFLSNRQEVGSNSATKIHMTADDDAILLTGGNCEIAGLYFKNYNNQSSIVGTGAILDCPHIHHNHFNLNGVTTGGVPAIDMSDCSSSFILIERNTFATNVSNLTFSSIISISSSCTWAKVLNNNFMCGDTCTWTICINNLSYKGQTSDNVIAALSGGGGANGTITTAIVIGGGIANGNKLHVVATADVSGGGAYSYILNYDGDGSVAAA
jgi:hypothetical protein